MLKRVSDKELMKQCYLAALEIENELNEEMLARTEHGGIIPELRHWNRLDIAKELFRYRSDAGRTFITMDYPE